MEKTDAKKKNKPEGELERLHVRIARSGLCSRRAAEKLIQEARVEVNGSIVVEMGVKVGPDDHVRVDGQLIVEAKHYTLMMHKPAGVVTTLRDPQGRPTIAQYFPNYGVQLKPVGRLDRETDGLILITNDGELAMRVTHPRYGLEKEYLTIVEGIPEDKDLERLRKGVMVEGIKTQPAKVVVNHVEERRNTASIKITIHEGRKRQVRLMCAAIGHPIIKLTRTRVGPFQLRGLRPGECKLLGNQELNELRAMVQLDPI